MIDRATVDRILDAANIVDVVSDFVTLKRAGANLKGLCPFHDDRTPSFMVSPSKNICKCFACGKGGTPVHFIMEHEQLSYPDALRYLAKKYHIEIKEREQTDEEKAEQSERESLFVVNEWANEWFQKQMNDTVDDIIKKFQLGFCPDKYDAQWQAGKAEGYNEDFLLKTGLCIRNEAGKTYDRFRNRVIFPIHSLSGKVVGFGGRVLDSRTKGVQVKYQNSPESSIYSKKRELYGIFFAKKAIVKEDLCYLVEGYTDVMAMHQQGVENVVASSGTALTHEQIRLIHRFTENITVIYDGDAAGIKASQRGIDMLLAEGMTVKLLLLPDGDDPDSFARKHTATEYQQYLTEHQVDFIRFKTDLLLDEAQGDPIKLSRLVNNIVESLAVIPDEITRTFYIKETSPKARKKLHEEHQKEKIKDTTGNGADTEKPETLPPLDLSTNNEGHPSPMGGGGGRSSAPSRIIRTEQLLVQMLIRYGEKVMCDVEDEETSEKHPLTVAEYISYTLTDDELTFRLPLHQQVLEETLVHEHDDGFRCDRYFENHPDINVANLANELAHDSETLSKIHEKGIPVKPEEERLVDLVPQLMTAYKLAIVEDELHTILQEMRDPAVLADKERSTALMQRFQEAKEAQKELGRQCGDRVIG